MRDIYRVIVRRDRPDVVATIRRMVRDVALLVDRRHADRRAAASSPPARDGLADRRQADRRRPPAAGWETKGFLVLGPADGP